MNQTHNIIARCLARPVQINFCQVRNHVKMYQWRSNRKNMETERDPTKTPYTDKYNMNEFYAAKKRKKPWQIVRPKEKDNQFNAYKWNEAYRSDPAEAQKIATSRLQSWRDSLLARGSARESKPYTPPGDVKGKVLTIYNEVASKTAVNMALYSPDAILELNLNQNRNLKFELLSRCIDHFKHDLSSAFLDEIETINDLVEYFSTPVRGINPYSAMLRQDVPENLVLIPDALRYNKESDTLFGGHEALPGVVSKVPGLRAAKKYPILNQDEFQWPDI